MSETSRTGTAQPGTARAGTARAETVQVASAEVETFNPWSVVNLVFSHLASHGLHPVLGESGDPGAPAATLLRALGIEPAAEGNRQVMRDVHSDLDRIRTAVLGEPPS